MNIRKSVDYSAMYAALDALMASELPQMELYCKVGKLVSERPEKGSAVAAAEYIQKSYPQASGFSPRNLRRMRDFYRMYGDNTNLMKLAMHVGWTQNIVIFEADLTMDTRAWYLKAAERFGWSKSELISQINASACLTIDLDELEIDSDEPEEATFERQYIPQFCFGKSKSSREICMQSGFRQRFLTFISTPRRWCDILEHRYRPRKYGTHNFHKNP